jgi:penicillin-binding protein 1C
LSLTRSSWLSRLHAGQGGEEGGHGGPPLRHLWRSRRFRWGLAFAFFLFVGIVITRSGLEAPPASLLLRDRFGRFVGEVAAEPERGYGFWPVDQVPERVVAATLALEDRRFYEHPGVDPLALARAIRQNLESGERISGGSTLAMQVARMQAPGSRSYLRKALEAATAIALTLRHGREGVLRHYLRIVPYGNQVHGITYAARRYLDKPVEDLSWAEIAFLAAIPQSPTRMNPYDPRGKARAIARGRRLLEVLHRRGALSAEELRVADAQIVRIGIPPRRQRPSYAMHVVLRFEKMLRAGQLAELEKKPLADLTLDLDLQREASWLLADQVEKWRPRGAGNGALLVVDQEGWEVVASLGSADFFAKDDAGAIDYLQVPRSPGSTLKPFVFGLALDQGLIAPNTVLEDLRRGAGGIGNSDGLFLGPLLPRVALANSRNVPSAELLARIGLDEGYNYFGRLGLHNHREAAAEYGLGMVIGSLPLRLEDLVRSYTVLAGGGLEHELVYYRGQPLLEPRRLLAENTARRITLFLADAGARQPTFPRQGQSEFPFAVAVKTGTSSQFRDALTVAYSSRYLVGAWLGHPDHRPMNGVTGYLSAAALVQKVLLHLHPELQDGLRATAFPPPAGERPVRLCPVSGKLAGRACGHQLLEYLPEGEADALEECPIHQLLGIDRRTGLLASHYTPKEEIEVRSFVELPAKYASYLRENGLAPPPRAFSEAGGRSPASQVPQPAVRLAAAGKEDLRIVSPRQGQRLLLDPETPAEMATLALQVEVDPEPLQVLWLVDGRPYRLEDYPFAARWPLEPGEHTFQAQIPASGRKSGLVRVLVE